ncbi:AUGMIN subunit 8-like [Oryza brachyantha]|uniref:AUGMIN subunit 8 n=1 Tax=Oryza brachyantha TaxID=4533 RepID=J3MXK3_ORYBR|nr:AUGMIN subunit 8-like [Oryza brachyantha]
MDALTSDVKKAALVNETRPPLVPSEKHNASPINRGRDVASRYKNGLSTHSAAATARRCTSPSPGQTSATEGTTEQKRTQSADRRRPSTPSRPSSRVSTPFTPASRSVTPVRSTVTEGQKNSRCITSTRNPDGLWPAMRNLSSSFQSESMVTSGNKKDKVVSSGSLDRAKGQTSVLAERKRSPLRRKNIAEHCENAQPSEDLPRRVMEQQRWPAMLTDRVTSNILSKSIDISDKASRSVPLTTISRGLSPRKMPDSEGMGKGFNKSLDEVARRLAIHAGLSDAKLDSGCDGDSQSTQRCKSVNRPSRAVTLPVPVLHHSSAPSKDLSVTSSISRSFQSPSRRRPSTPSRSQSAGSIQSGVSSPIISYMVDAKKGKKNSSQIDNIHQLRLFYNRHLQWIFVNACAEDNISFQKATAESVIYNVWRNTLNLRDAVSMRRIMLQCLEQELKLDGILKGQIDYLEQWPALEKENNISLFRATEALKASTLRLPVTSGAKADVVALKNAVSSAVDVMQGLGSAVCCMLPKVEDRTYLVSELSVIAGQENVMLDECRELLAMAAKLQVQESSLRTHLTQLKPVPGHMN